MKAAAICAFCLLFPTVAFAADSTPTDAAKIDQAFGKVPLYFIENQGQIQSEDVAYFVQGAEKTLYFTNEGITFSLMGENQRWTVKLDFVGANPDVMPRGEDQQEAIFSYFKGKPEDWKTECPTYGKIVYEGLWPGIDLVYSGKVNELKSEFVVKPGIDPSKIRLVYSGATNVALSESGELVVSTPVGEFEDGAPFAYQNINGEQAEVSVAYALREHSESGSCEYGFEIGRYDKTLQLVLDPEMLIYCGYIGGTSHDLGTGIAVDSQGNAYVAGSTSSRETTFPVTVGPDLIYHGGRGDAFVARVNAQGTALDYCGYIGGNNTDKAFDIAVDSQGNAYVTGATYSDETSFPVIVGPDLTYNGNGDAFVARVNSQGTALDYCGYIGGDDYELAYGIAVDTQGNAYATGSTSSFQTSFPVLVGPDLTRDGYYDAFVARVNAQGTALDYCGYIGGDLGEAGYGIAVDSQSNAYVAGYTYSRSNFPVAVGPDLTNNGYADAFVTRVNSQGTALDYCGYIGGSWYEFGHDIAVDSQGRAYVTGWTGSDEATFPVAVGPDLTFNGGQNDDDAFVARVNSQGTALEYCGYIGGSYEDEGYGIAVESDGCAFVTGYTRSWETSFPVTVGPHLLHSQKYDDAFVARVTADGTGLDYCGFIGGRAYEGGTDIALDGLGNAYVTGWTRSPETTFPPFPVTVGPDLTYNGGENDAFVAKIPAYHVLLRSGNVLTGINNPKDVLFVNGTAGNGAYRTIVNPPGIPVTVAMRTPPGGPNPAGFALYAWPGESGPDDVAVQPYDIGTACFPMPLGSGVPYFPPYTLVNNIGYPFLLGNPMLPGIPLAPTYIIQNQYLNPGTWTLQGIIYDNNSLSGTVSLTNAIVLVQQ